MELPSSPTHPLPHQIPADHGAISETAANIAGSLQLPLKKSASQPVSEHKSVPIGENPAVKACAAIIARTLNIEDIKALANMPKPSSVAP